VAFGLVFAFGLEEVLGCPGGIVKALAAGFGMNSFALTLNRADTADVGVRTVLDACELGTPATLAPDLLGGF